MVSIAATFATALILTVAGVRLEQFGEAGSHANGYYNAGGNYGKYQENTGNYQEKDEYGSDYNYGYSSQTAVGRRNAEASTSVGSSRAGVDNIGDRTDNGSGSGTENRGESDDNSSSIGSGYESGSGNVRGSVTENRGESDDNSSSIGSGYESGSGNVRGSVTENRGESDQNSSSIGSGYESGSGNVRGSVTENRGESDDNSSSIGSGYESGSGNVRGSGTENRGESDQNSSSIGSGYESGSGNGGGDGSGSGSEIDSGNGSGNDSGNGSYSDSSHNSDSDSTSNSQYYYKEDEEISGKEDKASLETGKANDEFVDLEEGNNRGIPFESNNGSENNAWYGDKRSLVGSSKKYEEANNWEKTKINRKSTFSEKKNTGVNTFESSNDNESSLRNAFRNSGRNNAGSNDRENEGENNGNINKGRFSLRGRGSLDRNIQQNNEYDNSYTRNYTQFRLKKNELIKHDNSYRNGLEKSNVYHNTDENDGENNYRLVKNGERNRIVGNGGRFENSDGTHKAVHDIGLGKNSKDSSTDSEDSEDSEGNRFNQEEIFKNVDTLRHSNRNSNQFRQKSRLGGKNTLVSGRNGNISRFGRYGGTRRNIRGGQGPLARHRGIAQTTGRHGSGLESFEEYGRTKGINRNDASRQRSLGRNGKNSRNNDRFDRVPYHTGIEDKIGGHGGNVGGNHGKQFGRYASTIGQIGGQGSASFGFQEVIGTHGRGNGFKGRRPGPFDESVRGALSFSAII